ncbi:MAG: LuxR C-terminal-related transcriptional regulator [Dehalococcoidia bacterium]
MYIPADARDRILALRARRGLSQAGLARRLGVPVALVSRWERGAARPTARQAKALAALEGDAAGRPAPEAPPMTSFLGRDEDLEGLASLLDTHRLVTVAGPGGAGKTRLVQELTRRCPERWGDVWSVALAPLAEPADVFLAVALAAGVAHGAAASQLGGLAARVRGPVLLVLDNCEHLVEPAASLVAGLLAAAPALRVIATSRETLRVEGERVWRIAPLGTPSQDATVEEIAAAPSVQLFLDRARARRPSLGWDGPLASDVGTICRASDGLPLAIELAAAMTAGLSVHELARRLTDGSSGLSEGARSLPERQRTMHATVAWSYALLSPAEQAALDRLSVFAGGFEIDAAEAVCDLPETPALVASLVEKSLLTFQERDGIGRYGMLESIRQFAGGRLSGRPDAATAPERMAHFFRSLAAAHAAGTGNIERRLHRDLPNFLLALDWALAHEPGEALIGLVRPTTGFWAAYGHAGAGLAWFDRALSSESLPDATRAVVLNAATANAAFAGEPRRALAYATAAAEAARRAADSAALVSALFYQGLAHERLGDFAEAFVPLEAALEVAPASARASPLLELAWCRSAVGDLAGARALIAQVSPGGASENPRLAAAADLYLGDTYVAEGDLATAMACYDRSLARLQAVGGGYEIAAIEGRFGVITSELGAFAEALGHFARAWPVVRPAWGNHYVHWIYTISLVPLAAATAPEQAALLHGASEATRGLGNTVLPYWQAFYDNAIARAKRAAGEQRFAALAREGERLTLIEAVDGALSAIEAALSHPAAAGAPFGAGLSERESGVLQFVASGASNKEIASALAISPRTVERHLANIYAKIDARGRADAIAWAAAHRDQPSGHPKNG